MLSFFFIYQKKNGHQRYVYVYNKNYIFTGEFLILSSKCFKFERKLHFGKNGRPENLQNKEFPSLDI